MKPTEFGRRIERSTAELMRSASIVALGIGRSLPMLQILACEGLSDITIIDPDTVDPRNIGQSAYGYSSIGKGKVDEAERLIRELQPDVAIRKLRLRDSDVPNLGELFARADLVIDAIDSLEPASRQASLGIQCGVDVLHIRNTGDNARFFIAGTLHDRIEQCGCVRCILKGAFDQLDNGYRPPARFDSHRVIPERLNINAASVALGLLHYRAGSSHPFAEIGRVFVENPCWVGRNGIDLSDGTIFPVRPYREPLPKGWQCPVCRRIEP